MSLIEPSTHLCRHCGLCCQGVLFSRVRVYSEEIKTLSGLGLHIYEKRQGQHYFNFPCPKFRFGVCGIYKDQPTKCGKYRCRLLKRLLKDQIELSDALAIVDQTIDLSNSVASHLDKLYSPKWDQTYIKDLIRKLIKSNPENSIAIDDAKKLIKILDEHFEEQSLLKKFPAADNKGISVRIVARSSKRLK